MIPVIDICFCRTSKRIFCKGCGKELFYEEIHPESLAQVKKKIRRRK